MMQDGPIDFAQRAAEKFLAANRAEDAREATQLRREAYELVELIKAREEGSEPRMVGGMAAPRLDHEIGGRS
jgi:hypothetical protein